MPSSPKEPMNIGNVNQKGDTLDDDDARLLLRLGPLSVFSAFHLLSPYLHLSSVLYPYYCGGRNKKSREKGKKGKKGNQKREKGENRAKMNGLWAGGYVLL